MSENDLITSNDITQDLTIQGRQRRQLTLDEIPDRVFRLWEYTVSLKQLLLRSEKRQGQELNVDVVFSGVVYLRIPCYLRGLRFTSPVPEEVAEANDALGRDLGTERVFTLVSGDRRYLVVAVHVHVQENDLERFETPFVLPAGRRLRPPSPLE